MHTFWLVYPMFVMVLLTFLILITMFRARVRSVKDGKMNAAYYKTYQGQSEPESVQKLTRHFTNLFEAPVLFYVGCLAALVTGATGMPFLMLAWAYVILRIAHAYIHLGRNKLMPRKRVYFSSWIVLLAMWSFLIVRIAMLG